MGEQTIEWGPLDLADWPLECKPGAMGVQGLADACIQVYVDSDVELRNPKAPWHWYVQTWGERAELSQAGWCATAEDAKRAALEFALKSGILPRVLSARELDDQTLDLFGGGDQ